MVSPSVLPSKKGGFGLERLRKIRRSLFFQNIAAFRGKNRRDDGECNVVSQEKNAVVQRRFIIRREHTKATLQLPDESSSSSIPSSSPSSSSSSYSSSSGRPWSGVMTLSSRKPTLPLLRTSEILLSGILLPSEELLLKDDCKSSRNSFTNGKGSDCSSDDCQSSPRPPPLSVVFVPKDRNGREVLRLNGYNPRDDNGYDCYDDDHYIIESED